MASDLWTLTCGGVTKSAAAWGLRNLSCSGKSCGTGELKFRAAGQPIDTAPIFAEKSWVTLQRNGLGWFAGKVTKVPRAGSTSAEDVDYIISDPWYEIEKTTFQQMWVVTNLTGTATTSVTTTQSRVTLSQSLDGEKMNLGQVLQEVLIYMLYAAQGLPFPTTVDLNHLPPLPAAGAGKPATFQIGRIMPSLAGMTVPYRRETDVKCGEIIRGLLRYVPDVIQWFDFSTSPPTLNFDHRFYLPAATIKAVTSSVYSDGYAVSGFNPTLREDLQVPVVICKYEQNNNFDGKSYASLSIDKYPLDGLDNDPDAFVQTVNLVGGHATFQHQDVMVQNLPTDPGGSATMPWVKSHVSWLFGTASAPTIYDVANISVQAILGKDLWEQDPYVLDPESAPTGFALKNLTAELLHGAVAPWMNATGIFAANVVMAFRLSYTGTDLTTAALFQGDPANPGTRIEYVKVMGTNAETKTYKQMTSYQQPEPVPVGYAQLLYTTLGVPHWQGSLEITEPECSRRLSLGAIFNTSDGKMTSWRTMNALVLKVTEDIDSGRTRIDFGPTMHLGLEDLVELARANRGRLFAYDLSSRTTGEKGNDNAVIGHTRVPIHATFSSPTPTTAEVGPFQLTYGPDPAHPGQYRVKVDLNGVFLKNDATNMTITGLGEWRNLNPNDTLWMEGTITGLTIGDAALKSYGNGDNGLTAPNTYWVTGGLTEGDSNSPRNQTLWRRINAEFIADAKGAPTLKTRQTTTNLAMFNVPLQGSGAVYPYAY